MSADTGMDVSPSWQELKDTLDQICDVFQIGERARSPSTILANVENVARFADYLHAIEREFLMVPGEADDDFPDEEPEDECLVNSWGARSREHYVEQFRRALARRDAEAAASLRFPTVLRKMWSGGEVQKWLDDQATEIRLRGEGGDDIARKDCPECETVRFLRLKREPSGSLQMTCSRCGERARSGDTKGIATLHWNEKAGGE